MTNVGLSSVVCPVLAPIGLFLWIVWRMLGLGEIPAWLRTTVPSTGTITFLKVSSTP